VSLLHGTLLVCPQRSVGTVTDCMFIGGPVFDSQQSKIFRFFMDSNQLLWVPEGKEDGA
jgi:hypothetical protein